MRKAIILFVFVFLVSLFAVEAVFQNTSSNLVYEALVAGNTDCAGFALNPQNTIGQSPATTDGASTKCDSAGLYINDTGASIENILTANRLINLSSNTNNFTIEFAMNFTDGTLEHGVHFVTENSTDNLRDKWIITDDNTNIILYNAQTGGTILSFGIPPSSDFNNYKFVFFLNNTGQAFLNGIFKGDWDLSAGLTVETRKSNISHINFGDYDINAGTGTAGIKDFYMYNGTTLSAQAQPDTTPPNILHYNLSTPSGDCIVWNTSKSTACLTGDTTPSISIITDDDSDCAIGLVDKNFTYYEGLGVNRSCENGGTTSLICSLRPEDELTYQDSTVYIGCRNSDGYENLTSTSGALSLTITGLEAGTQSAIGVGVQNALLSGYVNYTDQQIYARKLDGTQDKGTFDWVAKKGSKIWAFNYITAGEEHVGMFNMSPSLYVLEMSNITNSTIINLVELAINSTK